MSPPFAPWSSRWGSREINWEKAQPTGRSSRAREPPRVQGGAVRAAALFPILPPSERRGLCCAGLIPLCCWGSCGLAGPGQLRRARRGHRRAGAGRGGGHGPAGPIVPASLSSPAGPAIPGLSPLSPLSRGCLPYPEASPPVPGLFPLSRGCALAAAGGSARSARGGIPREMERREGQLRSEAKGPGHRKMVGVLRSKEVCFISLRWQPGVLG